MKPVAVLQVLITIRIALAVVRIAYPITFTVAIMAASLLQSTAAIAADVACKTPVGSWSSREKMMTGDFTANVFASELSLAHTSVGFGSTALRQNETTIVDGIVYRAHPNQDQQAIVDFSAAAANQGFVMLQMASPKAWLKMPQVLDAIASFDDLNFELDDQSENLGCGEDVLLPFKIVGKANSVTWRLDTQPNKLKRTSHNKAVTIVGIYNRNDRQHYFMSEGYHLHAHVLMTDDKIAGHLENIDLLEGATLYLPKK